MAGIRAEAAHYSGVDNPTGMSNQTVFRSDFNGSIVDVVGSKQITAGALSEPYGGEDPVLAATTTAKSCLEIQTLATIGLASIRSKGLLAGKI